jgi:hypothetical protein
MLLGATCVILDFKLPCDCGVGLPLLQPPGKLATPKGLARFFGFFFFKRKLKKGIESQIQMEWTQIDWYI